MAMWPFGRRTRRRSKCMGAPVSDLTDPAQPCSRSSSLHKHGTRISSGYLVRRHQTLRKRKNMVLKEKSLQASDPETRLPQQNRAEEITALPCTRELDTSPHLRPVMQDHANIPYHFQLHTNSHMHLSSLKERGNFQRVSSKRSAQDSALPRRKFTKKRKDNHIREEELRLMSAPILIPKSQAVLPPGLVKRESKKVKGRLKKNLERETSTVSLPVENSIHSSMSGASESRAFIITAIDVLSPRPRLRLSTGSHSGLVLSPIKSNSPSKDLKKERITITREALRESKTVDALADGLDSGDLRELMERDTRRKEKRRKSDEEALMQKLERRAERQRAKEEKRVQGAVDNMDIETQNHRTVGLGIGESCSRAREPVNDRDKNKEDTDAKSRDSSQLSYVKKESGIMTQRTLIPPDKVSILQNCPLEEPITEVTQTLGHSHSQGQLKILQSSEPLCDFPSELSERLSVVPQNEFDFQGPEKNSKRANGWTSFFRRGFPGRKGLEECGLKELSAQCSFANVSRESMAKPVLPAHLYQPPLSNSGMSIRTHSRFHEHLSEYQPDTRLSQIQHQETDMSETQTGSHFRDAKIDGQTSSKEVSSMKTRTDSPVSPSGRGSALMSQSLASIDSEGSWLSGKPVNRRLSMVHARSSNMEQGSAWKQRDEFAASNEDLEMAAYDEMGRMSVQEESVQSGRPNSEGRTNMSSIGRWKHPNANDEVHVVTSEGPMFETAVVRKTIEKQPLVVHRGNRVKSREGLLNFVQPVDESTSSPSMESSEKQSPASDEEMMVLESACVQRARSVDLSQVQARRLSAGSVKLLSIPARRQSTEKAETRRRFSSMT